MASARRKKDKTPRQNKDEKKQAKLSYKSEWGKHKGLSPMTNNTSLFHDFGIGSPRKPATAVLQVDSFEKIWFLITLAPVHWVKVLHQKSQVKKTCFS